MADRISFQRFLDFPETLPDYSTVWQFRERLAESDSDRLVWDELQRQLDARGLRVKKGVVRDATFIPPTPANRPGGLGETGPGPAGAGTAHGPGGRVDPSSATSSTPRPMST